jgi:thymidylate synthase (FAD)
MLPRFYVPKNMFTDVKRAELGDVPEIHERSDEWKKKIIASYAVVWRLYQDMIADGVRKEQARDVLPFGSFTEFWMSMNIRSWCHFLNLRTDSHAQLEARDLAEKVEAILTAHFPVSLAAWTRYGKGPIHGDKTIQTP